MKLSDVIVIPIYWAALLITRLVAILLGFIIVPLALCFVELPNKYALRHTLTDLPAWAKPWGNIRDGIMGDSRMWYWSLGYPKWIDKLPENWQSFMRCFVWLAIRNPTNTFTRYTRGVGCPVDRCSISYVGDYLVADDVGKEGFQFVKATGPTFTYWGLYHNIKLPDFLTKFSFFKGRAIIARMGHKVEPRHASADWSKEPTKAWKGWTFRPYMLQRVH